MSAVSGRHEHAPGADEADFREDILAVGFVEGANLGFFLGVGAHNADTGKVFLDARRKSGEGSLNFFVEFVNRFAEEPDGDGHDRSREQNPKRQGRRERDHYGDGQQHGDNRSRAVHDAGAENHATALRSFVARDMSSQCDCGHRIRVRGSASA